MYSINYYDNMLRNYSQTAKNLCLKRWEFVMSPKITSVLDYGSGVGWFRAFAPDYVECDTYDVMPVIQTGITKSFYDLVTFWDSLEHMTVDERENIFILADRIACTLPIKPQNVKLKDWKHFKPKEHYWYPTHEEVIETFKAHNFSLINYSETLECPPREDIIIYLFQKEGL